VEKPLDLGGMNLSRIAKSQFNVRVPVEAVALLLITFSLECVASTGPSWLQQPSWASEPPPPSRKGTLSNDRYRVSPFSPGSNNVALDVGQVFLMGDLGSEFSDNIGSRIHYTYGVSELFGFDASLGYSEHSDGRFSMTTLLTGLRTNLSWYDKVVPYFLFGMGFYKPSFQQNSVSLIPGQSSSSTQISPVLFGVHLGPGVDLELTKMLFFGAGITFHDVFGTTKITAGGPIEVGGTFTTFFLHAGVSF
jgi:hypothetical protein